MNIPTIKDALNVIKKLTLVEQECLKTMILSPTFINTLNIDTFVCNEKFANSRVCPLCGHSHVVRYGHRKDGTQIYMQGLW